MAQLTFNDDGSIRIPDNLKDEVPDLNKLGKIYGRGRALGKDVIMAGGRKDREFSYEKNKNRDKDKEDEDEDNLNILNYDEKYDEKEYNLGEDTSGFNLYSNGKKLEPLKFSNGKTQEDVVNEVIDLINSGKRAIFIKGVCGTGKSALALNLAKMLGKASIVVPGKALQKQYAEDYSRDKYVLKENHKKLKIKIITGRENHACLYERGCSANENHLPCKIEIKEPNMEKLNQYLKECGKNKSDIVIKDIRRISIAPACPYWSPIIPSEFEPPIGAKKVKYEGLKGINFTIYNRKEGCTYYNQFNSYLDAEAIIFNSAKYKLETLMNRKPATDVEIIDECDEFLDSFSNIRKINLNRFFNALIGISYEDHAINSVLKEIYRHVSEIINDEHIKELAKRNELIPLKETSIATIFSLFLDNPELIDGIDDENYCNEVAEMAFEFANLYGESYVSFSTEEKGIYANVATINLAKKFEELLEKNKVLVFMSGTIHEINVLKDVFGVKDFKIIEAETMNQGTIEVMKTGFEMDCKYENFASRNITRESYLIALDKCLEKAQKPILVHVNSFDDLPTIGEKEFFHLHNLITKEKLLDIQRQDRENKIVQNFKNGETDVLFTTKCNRGVDFPGEQCRSVVFTKYPNPNVNSIFWRMLRRNHPKYYWEFYRDKAKREFLQKIYRGVRSESDHVYLLSPDSRVLDAVGALSN